MILQIKYGWEPDVEKLEPFTQCDHETVHSLRLFDRCEDLLIFDNQEDATAAAAQLSNDASPELYRLLMVTDIRDVTPTDRFDDFAWSSSQGRVYMDFASIRVFRLQAATPESELAAAFMQLEEHRIAAFADHRRDERHQDDVWQAIESHLVELADRVARAYHCDIAWFDPDPS